MVKCKLVLKEQPTEEGLMPAVLPGLDTMVRRHQEHGWLEMALCFSLPVVTALQGKNLSDLLPDNIMVLM